LQQMSTVIGLCVLSLICFTTAAFNPPYYSQHDKRWGSKTLGQGPQTITQEGCLLTATASMVAFQGIKVNGALPNPSTMNSYLMGKKGFKGDILFYNAVEALGFSFEGIVTATADIKNAMNEGKFAMLHVLNGRHWVLATGFITGGYSVMDPGNVTHSYKYNDVVGCAVYSFPSSKIRKLYEQQPADDIQSQQSQAVNPNPNTESVITTSQNITTPNSPSSASSSPIVPSHSSSQQSKGSPKKGKLRKHSAK